MAITIRVPWSNPHNKDEAWNELLAWCVEAYGLPGERVMFHPTEEWMDFTFNDEHDALMFQLRTAGHRRTSNEITVDYFAQCLSK